MSNPPPPSSIILFTLLLIATGVHPEQPEPGTPVTRFQTYLRIKTAHPNPDYASAVSFLKSQAESIGLKTRTLHFAPNKPLLLLTWPGSDPTLPSLLLNSHLDSVPAEPSKWVHPPFSAHRTPDGLIFARGAQDDKCIAVQYLEAIRNLKGSNFKPIRTVHVSYVPDEEIGGVDGAAKFAVSDEFKELKVGFVLDEGQANPGDEFRVFYADRTPWDLIVKAEGMPGHGSRMFDNSAMENLMKSVEVMTRFREAQFDEVKAGNAAHSEVISVNPVYLKAGIVSGDGYAMNMQPSEAEAGFNIRIPPTVDPELVRKRIADEWAPQARNLTYQRQQHSQEDAEMMDAMVMNTTMMMAHLDNSDEPQGRGSRPGRSPNHPRNRVSGGISLMADYFIERPIFRAEEFRRREYKSKKAHGLLSFTWHLIEKGPSRDYMGRPLVTPTDDSNPWWSVFKHAVAAAGGKLAKPEILATTTDARFMRQQGIPTLGFSPMTNTPILLHDHNEFLKDTIFLKGIKVYESVISALSSFER